MTQKPRCWKKATDSFWNYGSKGVMPTTSPSGVPVIRHNKVPLTHDKYKLKKKGKCSHNLPQMHLGNMVSESIFSFTCRHSSSWYRQYHGSLSYSNSRKSQVPMYASLGHLWPDSKLQPSLWQSDTQTTSQLWPPWHDMASSNLHWNDTWPAAFIKCKEETGFV